VSLREILLGCLCILAPIVSHLSAAADGIWEIEGTFVREEPFIVQRSTDAEGGGTHSVVIEGDSAIFGVIVDTADPALALKDGVTLNLNEDGLFYVENASGMAISTPSTSGHKNAINLTGGTFAISGIGTAIDGEDNLQLTISAGGSIAGGTAIENLHSFTLTNNNQSYLDVTGLLDLSSAAQVEFADGAAIRFSPLTIEKSTGIFGENYVENGNSYIKLENVENVNIGDSLNVALDVKNFYPDMTIPNATQRIKLMECDNVTALQDVLQLSVENSAASFPGWSLSYDDVLNTVYAKFSTASIDSIMGSVTVSTPYGPNREETKRYVFVESDSSLSISPTGVIESDGETPILIDTSKDWSQGVLSITLGQTTSEMVAVDNANGVAIGQGTADGSSPFPAPGNTDFYLPNVSITGSGTIRGSAGSFKMCATGVTPDVNYAEERPMVYIGALTIGDSSDSVHMDGAIEMRLFDRDFGTADVQLDGGCYLNPFILRAGSSISGHLLLDGSVKTGGTFSGAYACVVEDVAITGDIGGKVDDTYGVCITAKSWVNSGEISSLVGGITLIGNISANADCPGNYVGLIVDAPASSSSVGGIDFAGSINASAGNSADDTVRIGTLVHAPVIAGDLTISGNVSGKNAALVFDGSGDGALEVPITLDNATLHAEQVAIGGRNASLHFSNGSTLNAASTAQFAIAPCTPTYAYDNGATAVPALETFSYESGNGGTVSSVNPANLALLRGSNLTLQLDIGGAFNACDMDIAVTGTNLEGANTITCGKLFLGGSTAIAAGNALNVADGIIFCADAAATANTLSISGAEGVLGMAPEVGDFAGVPKIDASFAAIGIGETTKGALIDISTTNSEAAAILPGGIKGNLSSGEGFTTNEAEQYVTVVLGGAGGSIGTEGLDTSGITNVGKLLINGNTNDSVWIINGNTSCGTLRIERGKMLQKGDLTIWGDLLLLGCDIDWTGNACFNHIYAKEDKITARKGASVKISNGFSAESTWNESVTVDGIQLNQEAVLLGGDSQFVVEPGATVSIGVAGCKDDKFGTDAEPVAIRVVGNSLKLGEALRQWPRDGQIIGNGNVIDLQNSLNLSYYSIGGARITPDGPNKVTAIRGNETTRLYLNGGTAQSFNSLAGTISNVGYVTVNGYWTAPQGLDECGCLTLGQSGHLDCAGANVNTWRITFCLDESRSTTSGSDAGPYLICNKLCNNYRDADALICFNFELSDTLLENPAPLNFCLVSGLTAEPHWICGTKINGVEPTISYDDNKISVLIPAMIAAQGISFEDFSQLNTPAITQRKVEFVPPDEYTLRSLWEQGLLVPYSVHQATITRKQNYLFRHAMGLENGNFANAADSRWHLTRTSYASYLRRRRSGPIINAVTANTCGSTIGLECNLPQGHLLTIAADYVTSHAHFCVWNNNKSYRCRMKGYGLGICGQFVNGPVHFGLSGIANENCHRYGPKMERLANVRFNGYSYNLAGNFSYALQHGKWAISPRVESNFDNIYHKNYVIDHGNMGISLCRTKFFQSALGVRASTHKETLQIIGDLSLSHDFQCSGGFSKATSAQNSCVIMPAYFPKRDCINGKFQISMPWRKSWEFAFDCDVMLQKRTQSYALTMGSIYHF
jgi:hypothetical protein